MSLAVKSEDEHRQDECLHRLRRINPLSENGFRYCCTVCGKYLLRKNGVVLPHPSTPCQQTNAWYRGSTVRQGGFWLLQFTCITCGRTGKFMRNYLGQRTIACDGVRFHKVQP